ncbi:Homogentisate 1,2-dioxygenase [Melanomma pulvis-pyrius CBS 109.77]|uniref:homogentisate 1,2-dioxygenase n=1 Tax=Melanomma pulvis-pyrius CBS 109.77 TaxID=1314802 RepID=A0A6A6XV59_9PLEO|nr:Homogentisate 1,2-dioxygenase [Melanomma pulvis-pyrius CBS 109.77]
MCMMRAYNGVTDNFASATREFNTRKFHWTDAKSKKPTRPEDPHQYLSGFGNELESEFIAGALPIGQNSPQICPYGLYAEQLTGSSFAASRANMARSFLYRRRPAAVHTSLERIEGNTTFTASFLPSDDSLHVVPSQLSWRAFQIPDKSGPEVDFTQGIRTLGGSGHPNIREGIAYHIYAFNSSMKNKAFANIDGDFLICAQEGHLNITTEFGHMYLQPSELCVIQRGIRFNVAIVEEHSPNGARGYIIETWGTKWELPELGPLGGYGLANSRDFLHPTASIDTTSTGSWTIITKQVDKYYASYQDHSPFDVVAWHGTFVPYKYDLTKFAYQNSVAVDHTDPSINTVLTAKSRDPDAPLCDFLVFGPRWDVAENTFRPPYFHRNCASEFLAKIYGPTGGGRSEVFVPGGASYEAGHTPHGNADQRTMGAMHMELKPMRVGENSLTIMLESCRSLMFTNWAVKDSGVLAAEDIPLAAWDLVPDRFGKDEEAQKLLRARSCAM